MAPKGKDPKKDAAPAFLPVVEDEVPLPEGVVLPESTFRCAVAHVVSHTFVVEEPQGEDPEVAPALQEFDACGILATRLRAPTEATPRRQVVLVHRTDLEMNLEGGTFVQAFMKKVDLEIQAKRRKKENTARRRHFGDLEGTSETCRAPLPEGDESDLTFVLLGYPETSEEISELRGAGAFEAVDVWLSVYLDGITIEEHLPPGVDDADAPEATPIRQRKACEPPEILDVMYDAIHAAQLDSGLANSTVRTAVETHTLALPAEESGERLLQAVLVETDACAAQRFRFDTWIAGAHRLTSAYLSSPSQLEAPDGAIARDAHSVVAPPATADTQLYERLADSIEPARQDVQFLLYCMCEQVALTLQGDAQDRQEGPPETSVAEAADDMGLDGLFGFLNEVHESVLLSGPTLEAAAPVVEEPSPDTIIPELDMAACHHYGQMLPGNVSALGEVYRMLSNLEAVGVRRSGFPEAAGVIAKASGTAARNKMYSFMPELPIVEIERLCLLHEFEKLLNRAQPERTWKLRDRVFHERIPASLLIQTLSRATQSEAFVDTAYFRRQDCLLVALHHRAPPGCLLWNSWLAPPGSSGGENNVLPRPTPTFNDWCRFFVSQEAASGEDVEAAESNDASTQLLDLDGREFGYGKVLDKLHMPADGSVILRTSLQRGLSETFRRPARGPDPQKLDAVGEDEAEEEEEDDVLDGVLGVVKSRQSSKLSKAAAAAAAAVAAFEPPPRYEQRVARILKDRFALSICTDEAWASYAREIREAREQREREVEEAARAAEAESAEKEAARIAQGLPPDEEEAGMEDDEAEEPDPKDAEDAAVELNPHRRYLEDLKCGIFRAVFPDGARCTLRLHHERRWFAEGETSYDLIVSRPGVVAAYALVSGATVQVFSDGIVRQAWPLQLFGSRFGDRHAASPLSTAAALGGPDDIELARVVTPLGTLVRELLSGRREIYYPSGTRAIRNPTLPELEEQRKRLQQCGCRAKILEVLDSFVGALAELQIPDDATTSRAVSAHMKSQGLVGHWRVVQPDGRVFGRAPAPPAPPIQDPPHEGEGDHGDEPPPDHLEVPGDAELEEELEDDDNTPAAILQTVLDGTIVDGGATIEYEIDAVSVTTMVDPHTGHTISTSIDNLLTYRDEDGFVTTSILPDNTHIFLTLRPSCCEIIVEKEGASRVTCTTRHKERQTHVEVECDDGARLKVTPQCLNLVGELVPADLANGNLEAASTNAMVSIERPDGGVVFSKGAGDVDICSGFDTSGDPSATLDRCRVYTAHLDEDKISLRDRDGNSFDVMGDQTVLTHLAVSMGDNLVSPRCPKSGQIARHPDAEFLPVPESVPEPRLFTVYSDGEAEELLLSRDVSEVLRLAEQSPDCVVTAEKMGAPMAVCRSHSILKLASSESAPLPLRPLDLPSIIAGFERPSMRTHQSEAGRSYTAFRQFVEYPPVHDAKRESFQERRARYEESEKEHKELHRSYGLGLVASIGATSGGA